MQSNRSPWIKQLNRTRPVNPLNHDAETDIVIVGGGIAGIVTAFFTLRDTKKSVVLLEADKIAHGATGHNAGQLVSTFERPISELVEEFGLDRAIDGLRAIESAWELVEEIFAQAFLKTPLHRFSGYVGLSGIEQVLLELQDNRHRVQGGLPPYSVLLAEEWVAGASIPDDYRDLYKTAAHEDILALLETKNPQYIAALSTPRGCMNSALFSEELLCYLTGTYKERFSFFEGSPVNEVSLTEDGATLSVLGHTVRAKKTVLCTNGFESFTIMNEGGADIDTEFHHDVVGRIGYMSGYLEPQNRPPVTITYFPRAGAHGADPTGDAYFYLTRRPHEHEGKDSFNLTCAGGPERVLPNGAVYSRKSPFPDDIQDDIQDFLRDNYEKHPGDGIEYAFSWHGLMGYTPSGVRRIGLEPHNKNLLYNLGCNGIGILPSIYGGKRISEILGGKAMKPSIFDPLAKVPAEAISA